MSKALIIRGANFYENRLDVVQFLESKPCTGLSISESSVSFTAIGDTVSLTATPVPSDTTDNIVWTSSNASIATVSAGVVTCVGVGTATITATCGNQTATCSVSYVGTQYIATDGSAYIMTDIPESATPFDFEAVVSNDLAVADYTSSYSGNGHVFSSINNFYPLMRTLSTKMGANAKINGTEGLNGTLSNYSPGTFAKIVGIKSGSNYECVYSSEDGQTTYKDTTFEYGSTYSASNKYGICTYPGDSATRFNLVGRVKYIKLHIGEELVYNFVAAKKKTSTNTYTFGLYETVNGIFYESDGNPFTGA